MKKDKKSSSIDETCKRTTQFPRQLLTCHTALNLCQVCQASLLCCYHPDAALEPHPVKELTVRRSCWQRCQGRENLHRWCAWWNNDEWWVRTNNEAWRMRYWGFRMMMDEGLDPCESVYGLLVVETLLANWEVGKTHVWLQSDLVAAAKNRDNRGHFPGL